MKIPAIMILLLLTCASRNFFGQSQDPSIAPLPDSVEWIRSMSADPRGISVGSPLRRSPRDESEMLVNLNRMESAHRGKLFPTRTYYQRFAGFLGDKNTGLARLRPDLKCDEGKVVGELESCASGIQVPGGGSYYSFRNGKNVFPAKRWADIHFTDDALITIEKDVFGIISRIGDAPLESPSVKSEGVKFLSDYKPATRAAEIQAERERFKKGVVSGDYAYSLSAPLKLDATYILRSIAYRDKKYPKTLLNAQNKHEDIIVAFKVVAKEPDGSLILLWKKLSGKNAPELREK